MTPKASDKEPIVAPSAIPPVIPVARVTVGTAPEAPTIALEPPEKRFEEALQIYRQKNIKRVDLCRELNLDYHAFTYFLKTRHPELILRQSSKKTSDYIRNQRKETDARYRKALKLCRETDSTYKEIAEETGVSLSGLKTYIATYHRDLLLQRKGMKMSRRAAQTTKVRGRSTGQTIFGHERYRDAIEACDSLDYLECSVSEIATIFGVPATGLLAQLRDHYPEVAERREKVREERGLADNLKRGARSVTKEQYAEAIELLKDPSVTIEEAAERCNVSFGGLRNYMLSYHKDIVESRRKVSSGKYDEAVKLYLSSDLTVKDVATKLGLVYNSFASYLRRNNLKK